MFVHFACVHYVREGVRRLVRRAVARGGLRVIAYDRLIVARFVLSRRVVSVACLFVRPMALVKLAMYTFVARLSSTLTHDWEIREFFLLYFLSDDVR